MRIVNSVATLPLALATIAVGLFFMGSKEQHDQMIIQHSWGTLGLRFAFASAVGLVGAGFWWGVNYGLLKSGLVQYINLRETALLVVVGVLSGSLVGALIFCLP